MLWAEILAAAPNSRDGRVSKPAVDLLKQFDRPIALMFQDLVKYASLVGFPSTKVGSNFAPFGTTINFDLLQDLGIIQNGLAATLAISGLGSVAQVQELSGGLLNSLGVFYFRERALELAGALLQEYKGPHERLHELRFDCLLAYADDLHWSMDITPMGRSEAQYRIPSANQIVKDVDRDEAVQRFQVICRWTSTPEYC